MDLNEQLAAVERTVKKTTLSSGEEGRVITLQQTFPVNQPALWGICTSPDRIKQFFSPVSGDLHVNGRFQVENNASGTIEECVPPSKFLVTWEFGGDTSRVQISIDKVDESASRLELSHTLRVNKHWEEYGAGAGGVGWEMSFAGLGYHLQGIKNGQEWFANEETRNYLTKCSERWGEAAVKGGESPEAAQEAAKRTTVFYVPPKSAA